MWYNTSNKNSERNIEMKILKNICCLILAVVTAAGTGCVSLVEKLYPETAAESTGTAFVPVDIAEGSVYFKDFDGNEIMLDKAPESVASLSVVSTEILCGLGAGRYISVINSSSKEVEGAPIGAAVVDNYCMDAGVIEEASPDIVFYTVSNLSVEAASKLREDGYILIRIPDSGDIAAAEANIRFISSVMYKDQRGEDLIAEMRSEIEKIRILAEFVGVRSTVYIESSNEFCAVGGNSITSELCGYLGAENIFNDKKGTFMTNAEELTRKNPEVIIILTDSPEDFSTDTVRKREGMTDVYACRTKNIHAIDVRSATRPTQNIVKAMRELSAAFKITK